MLHKLQNMTKEGGYLIIVYVVQDKHTFSWGAGWDQGGYSTKYGDLLQCVVVSLYIYRSLIHNSKYAIKFALETKWLLRITAMEPSSNLKHKLYHEMRNEIFISKNEISLKLVWRVR